MATITSDRRGWVCDARAEHFLSMLAPLPLAPAAGAAESSWDDDGGGATV